jgi:hypothetical protein
VPDLHVVSNQMSDDDDDATKFQFLRAKRVFAKNGGGKRREAPRRASAPICFCKKSKKSRRPPTLIIFDFCEEAVKIQNTFIDTSTFTHQLIFIIIINFNNEYECRHTGFGSS